MAEVPPHRVFQFTGDRGGTRPSRGGPPWWRESRFWGETVLVALLIGLLLAGLQIWQDRQSEIRQGAAEDRRAVEAERRENVRFVRTLSDVQVANRPFSGMDLSGQTLAGLVMTSADFRRADLRGADLSGADLRNATLEGADLRGADLSRARLTGANLNDADLRGADLSYSSLDGADRLEDARFDTTTEFDLSSMRDEAADSWIFERTDLVDVDLPGIPDPSAPSLIGVTACLDEDVLAEAGQTLAPVVATISCPVGSDRGLGTARGGTNQPLFRSATPDEVPGLRIPWSEIADRLLSAPGTWVVVPRAARFESQIANQRLPWFRQGLWDTRTEGRKLFLSYLGPSG